MPQFSYKARRRSGELVEGMLEVADRPTALVQIERLGLFPVAVEASRAAGVSDGARGEHRSVREMLPPALRQVLGRRRKPRLQELATYTTQLANLLKSGMPLTVALNSMTHLETPGIPADITRELRREVMEGRGLSDAMAKQPVIFSDLYINMVRAGESSGSLVDVLRRMASHFQQFAEVQSKFKSALIYPAMVCVVGAGIVAFFMFFMLPRFMTMFTGFNMALPLPTRMLMAFSNMVTNPWFWVVLIPSVLAVVVLFFRFRATENGKRKIDEWKMNAPIVGKVVKLNLFGQFSRTLSTLLQNGVPVLTALKITEQIIPNIIMKESISNARQAVTDGKTLAQPLATGKVFPQLMVDLVRIGEETGDVPGALASLADTYEGELQIGLRSMTNLIEPLLIIFMSIGVGFLLISILLPMFNLISAISSGGGVR
jgi:type II secretory pathway component PulF